MGDDAARNERGTHVRSLNDTSPTDVAPSVGRDRGELGLLLVFQFGAFVAVAFATLPFVTDDGELRAGLMPILAALCAAWPVLFAGVVTVSHRRHRPWRDMVGATTVRGVDLGALLVGVMLQFVVGIGYFVAGVDDDRVSGPARDLTDRTGGLGLGFAVLAVFVVIGAPVFEELFYRGAVLNGVRRAQGSADAPLRFDRPTVVAIAVSSIWFGLIHGQLLQLPALIAVGVVCAAARVRTGRLCTAVLLHAGFNLTTIVALGVQLAGR